MQEIKVKNGEYLLIHQDRSFAAIKVGDIPGQRFWKLYGIKVEHELQSCHTYLLRSKAPTLRQVREAIVKACQ